MRRTSQDRGFSLVELLIAIGIIAILVALLMPVLSRVRQAARSTACLANLQQWGDAFHLYLNGNAGKAFTDRQSLTDPAWYELLQSQVGDAHRLLICPEATEAGNVIGSATKAWGPERAFLTLAPTWTVRDTFVGSYGFNAWLFDLPPGGGAANGQRGMFGRTTRESALIPIFGDCIVATMAAPRDTDDVPTDLQNPLPHYSGTGPVLVGPNGTMSYFCIDRHRRAVNLVFLDGHAARVPLAELWHQKWNAEFTPRDVVIPQ